MIKKIKNYIMTIATMLAVAAPALVPVAVYAQDPIKCGVNSGAELNLSGKDCTVKPVSGAGGLQGLVVQVINIFSVIVGVVAVIMIIWGGLKYITSGGESSNVSGAKNTIIYAIIGLIIVALSQFIVRFVLQTTNGVTT